jgi:hypothetical protein
MGRRQVVRPQFAQTRTFPSGRFGPLHSAATHRQNPSPVRLGGFGSFPLRGWPRHAGRHRPGKRCGTRPPLPGVITDLPGPAALVHEDHGIPLYTSPTGRERSLGRWEPPSCGTTRIATRTSSLTGHFRRHRPRNDSDVPTSVCASSEAGRCAPPDRQRANGLVGRPGQSAGPTCSMCSVSARTHGVPALADARDVAMAPSTAAAIRALTCGGVG